MLTKENSNYRQQNICFSWSGHTFTVHNAAELFYKLTQSLCLQQVKDTIARMAISVALNDNETDEDQKRENLDVLHFLFEWFCNIEQKTTVE